jgi:hypothetical protein
MRFKVVASPGACRSYDDARESAAPRPNRRSRSARRRHPLAQGQTPALAGLGAHLKAAASTREQHREPAGADCSLADAGASSATAASVGGAAPSLHARSHRVGGLGGGGCRIAVRMQRCHGRTRPLLDPARSLCTHLARYRWAGKATARDDPEWLVWSGDSHTGRSANYRLRGCPRARADAQRGRFTRERPTLNCRTPAPQAVRLRPGLASTS